MNTLILNPILSRLGLTVLHALWELLALGLLAWAGLALLRRWTASTRYLFACAFLLAMVTAPVVTFFLIGPGPGTSPALIQQVEGGALAVVSTFEGSGWVSLLLRVSTFAPWLAIFWSLGVTAMILRLGGGIWWLDRTYRAQARPASASWQTLVNQMAHRMGLRHPVRLLESQGAETPLVIGWLRPVILVPVSALLNLSPAALEAVLAHELAHIRRLDYLANLLQCVAEALLFFHPAAWLLSRQIRELREHCCDDAAAALCGDPMILAEGLSALERLRRSLHSDPEPALAAAKGKLMSRITRLFRPQDVQAPSLRGLVIALAGISCLGAIALTAQQATAAKKPATSPTAKAKGQSLRITKQPPVPPYPAEARGKNIQGVVVLRLHINAEGVPEGVDVSQGPEELRASSIAYARAWRFQPRPKEGGAGNNVFQLNLLYELKGVEGVADQSPQIPSASGPSATVEILARAANSTVKPAGKGVSDFDFSRIQIVHRPKMPPYPADAREQKIQGTVVVSIMIDEQGVPLSAEALEGPSALKPTAVEWAKDWRFKPAMLNGKPVQASFKLTMVYKLK